MFGETLTYIGQLLSHWAAFMTGGIPAAIFLVAERFRRKPFEWRTFFFVFIVFGFFAASYQTWHEEYAARLEVGQNSAKNPDARKAQLEQLYVEGREIANRLLPKDISPDDFNHYKSDADAWLHKTVNWIQANLGEVAKARFLDTSGMLTFSYGGAVNSEHSQIVNGVNNFCKNLQTLIVEFDAWAHKKVSGISAGDEGV